MDPRMWTLYYVKPVLMTMELNNHVAKLESKGYRVVGVSKDQLADCCGRVPERFTLFSNNMMDSWGIPNRYLPKQGLITMLSDNLPDDNTGVIIHV